MMDWYAWLSQTSLDATLIYEYGVALLQNEVEEEDIPFFNHDFLQSLGISIAKHRLEILKLCKKDAGGFSRLISKTRKLFARKLGFQRGAAPHEISPYRSQWSGALRRIAAGGEGRNVLWSGPIDRRLMACQTAVSGPNWSPIVGPRRQRQRPALVCRSPTMSGPIERLGLSPKLDHADAIADRHAAHSLWSIMFQDMKPT